MRGTIFFACFFLYAFSITAQEKSLPTAPSFTVRDLDNKLIITDGKVHLHTRGFVPGDEVKLEKELREILKKE